MELLRTWYVIVLLSAFLSTNRAARLSAASGSSVLVTPSGKQLCSAKSKRGDYLSTNSCIESWKKGARCAWTEAGCIPNCNHRDNQHEDLCVDGGICAWDGSKCEFKAESQAVQAEVCATPVTTQQSSFCEGFDVLVLGDKEPCSQKTKEGSLDAVFGRYPHTSSCIASWAHGRCAWFFSSCVPNCLHQHNQFVDLCQDGSLCHWDGESCTFTRESNHLRDGFCKHASRLHPMQRAFCHGVQASPSRGPSRKHKTDAATSSGGSARKHKTDAATSSGPSRNHTADGVQTFNRALEDALENFPSKDDEELDDGHVTPSVTPKKQEKQETDVYDSRTRFQQDPLLIPSGYFELHVLVRNHQGHAMEGAVAKVEVNEDFVVDENVVLISEPTDRRGWTRVACPTDARVKIRISPPEHLSTSAVEHGRGYMDAVSNFSFQGNCRGNPTDCIHFTALRTEGIF